MAEYIQQYAWFHGSYMYRDNLITMIIKIVRTTSTTGFETARYNVHYIDVQ